MDKEPTAPNS